MTDQTTMSRPFLRATLSTSRAITIQSTVFARRASSRSSAARSGAVSAGDETRRSLRMIRTRSWLASSSEIDTLYSEYGFTGYMFYDDELNVNQSIVELMNAIADLQRLKGRNSGCAASSKPNSLRTRKRKRCTAPASAGFSAASRRPRPASSRTSTRKRRSKTTRASSRSLAVTVSRSRRSCRRPSRRVRGDDSRVPTGFSRSSPTTSTARSSRRIQGRRTTTRPCRTRHAERLDLHVQAKTRQTPRLRRRLHQGRRVLQGRS